MSKTFHTNGNKIVDDKGHIVKLKGVSRTGLEYNYVDLNAMIPETIDMDIRMMKEWGFNSIRFPIRDVFWLNDILYRNKIKYWVDRTLNNSMIPILDLHTQQNHIGLDNFMLKMGYVKEMWVDIAQTYKGDHRIFFEIFNEPHNIDVDVWWNGDSTYYGYNEILKQIRAHADNICIIGGLDYAYQWAFLKKNTTLLKQIQAFDNIVLSTHPYGYRGHPTSDGTGSIQIPTIVMNVDKLNYTGDCHLGITVPVVSSKEYGWTESFGFVVEENLFPMIATEWGLDRPDNCIQGGWYNTEMLDYLNFMNISYMAWAWVQDRLDYPSLLGENFVPTGRAVRETFGPACSGAYNQYYPGPGVLIKNDLQTFNLHHRNLKIDYSNTTDPEVNSIIFRNFMILFLILFSVFNIFFIFPYPKYHEKKPSNVSPSSPIHRSSSVNNLQSSIRIRSVHSFPS